jgi:hypothetical protein
MREAREWFAKLPPKLAPGKITDTPRDLYEEAAALLGVPELPADVFARPGGQ